MAKMRKSRRWVFVFIVFFFMVFHQFDIFLLGPINTQLITEFYSPGFLLNPSAVFGVIVSILFFLIWGYSYDRHSRKNLLSVASFIWGATSLLMGISPTASTYIISNAAGGIDNASTSGIFSLVGDFFKPRNRSKIFGLFFITQPLAFFLGLYLTNATQMTPNWRLWLIIFSIIGLIFSIVIFWLMREPKRGACEPAMVDVDMTGTYLFDWEIASTELVQPALLLIYFASFFGIIPWFTLITWMQTYLSKVCVQPECVVYPGLIRPLIALAVGYPLGGFLGDLVFHKKKSGRMMVGIIGVMLPGLFLHFAFKSPDAQSSQFIINLALLGLFMAFSRPNIMASVMDVTLPEVRSTAYGVLLLFETLGTLVSPILVILLQRWVGLGTAILWVGIGSWLVCTLLQIGLIIRLPKDIEKLRRHMAYRSHLEMRLANPD